MGGGVYVAVDDSLTPGGAAPAARDAWRLSRHLGHSRINRHRLTFTRSALPAKIEYNYAGTTGGYRENRGRRERRVWAVGPDPDESVKRRATISVRGASRSPVFGGPGAGASVRRLLRMSDERIPMSREGYDKLKADLDRMQNQEMIEVTKRIAAARELGDLSENAEYHAAREDQGMLQARIDKLKFDLSRAFIVEPGNVSTEAVVFGVRVKVKDLDGGDEEEFE